MESYLVQVQLNDSCRDSDCHSLVSHPHPKRDFRLSRFSFWIRQFFPRFDWITTLFSVLAVAGILFEYVPKHQTVVPQLSAVSHTSKFVSVTDVNQDVVSHLFELKVVGQDDIELAVVRASCGCMSFAVDGDPLTKGHWVNVNDRRVMKFAVQVPARPGVEQHNFEVQARLRKSPQIVSTPVRCSTQTSIYKPLVVRTNQVQGSFRSPDDPVSITVDLQLVVPSGSAPPVDELSIALADPLSSFQVQPREKQSGRREKLSDEWDSWAVSLGAIVIPSLMSIGSKRAGDLEMPSHLPSRDGVSNTNMIIVPFRSLMRGNYKFLARFISDNGSRGVNSRRVLWCDLSTQCAPKSSK